jgi:hypothetical protein
LDRPWTMNRESRQQLRNGNHLSIGAQRSNVFEGYSACGQGARTAKSCSNERIVCAFRRNLKASHYGMHIRLMCLIEGSLNLTHDFAFLCGLHESQVFRVVQPDGPGMLQAGNGGDSSALISFVSTRKWPTPVRAAFRAGTRSTISKNPQRDNSQLTNNPDTPYRQTGRQTV